MTTPPSPKLDQRKRERLACDLDEEAGKDIAAARRAIRVLDKYDGSGELTLDVAIQGTKALETLIADVVERVLRPTGL